ncbi:MAG: sugar phosphate isomerase/epimerase family protein [Limisphaerales bacterium]
MYSNQSPLPALSRREFLRSTGTALGLAALAAAAPGAISAQDESAKRESGLGGKGLVGSQLYGWGQYYQRMNKNLNEHLDEVLSAIRDCGYDYAEGPLDASHPENNARFADQLRAKGLRPVSLYTGGRLHEEAAAGGTVDQLVAAAKACHQAGFRVINCNPDPIGREKTDGELNVQAAALSRLGKELKRSGLRLGVHNHTPEMADHAREFHFNFRHTDAASVGFCFDVHWVYRGGIAPIQALNEYGKRVVSWHLRQSRGGIWWQDLDTGDIDYGAVARYAKDHRLPPLYTVELALETKTQITRSVVENHQRSRDFVRTVFGV